MYSISRFLNRQQRTTALGSTDCIYMLTVRAAVADTQQLNRSVPCIGERRRMVQSSSVPRLCLVKRELGGARHAAGGPVVAADLTAARAVVAAAGADVVAYALQ